MNDFSDARLVAMAQRGNQRALTILLQRHRPAMQRQLRRFPIDATEQSDLLQEAMLQVLRKIESFRGDAQFSTWLYRLTANAALMRMRSIRRRRQVSLGDTEQEIERSFAASAKHEPTLSPEESIDDAKRNALLERALSELPQGHRDALLGHYIDGAGLQQLAEQLDTTESAIRSRIHRARIALRKQLREELPQHAA